MSEKIKEKFIKEEYELQHFGFCSYDLISQFQNIFHVRLDENLKDLEEAVAEKFSLDISAKEKLHNVLITNGNLVKDIVNEKFESKEFLNKIYSYLNIPENIVLSDDLLHNEYFCDDTVESLTKEIAELEKQYKKEKLLCVLYEEELNTHSSLGPLEENFKVIQDAVDKWPKLTHLKRVVDKENVKISFMVDIKQNLNDNLDLNVFNNFSVDIECDDDNCTVED